MCGNQTPAVDALLSDAEAEPEMSLVLDTVGNVFRFEQAVPQTTIVADALTAPFRSGPTLRPTADG